MFGYSTHSLLATITVLYTEISTVYRFRAALEDDITCFLFPGLLRFNQSPSASQASGCNEDLVGQISLICVVYFPLFLHHVALNCE